MFFNFGPFGYQNNRRPQRPRNQQPQNQQNQGGFFNGLNDFLGNGFMNPLFRRNEHEEPQEQVPRPTFSRMSSRKDKNKADTSMKEKVVYSENTGIYWKEKGNKSFKEKEYEKALECYNKAIELNNTESIFFSNRARCLKKMQKYEEALKDAIQAIQLDTDNIKGHLIAGQILAEIGKNTKEQRKVKNAITRLTKALTLCTGQNKNEQFRHQLTTYIYRAKKLLWYLQFEEIREKRIKAINEYKTYLEKDPTLQKQTVEKKLEEFLQATNESIIFQIPDYLICRITLQLMEDPVVTDSGHIYQKSAIHEHLERNGKTDPFTRKPISGNLYPCIPIKKAIDDFLEKNPWAYEYLQGQTYHDIAF